MHQSHWYVCFFANDHRYHSNNSYNDVRFGNKLWTGTRAVIR